MSKKDDTIKALKKKLKKLQSELDALTGPGKKLAKPVKDKSAKDKSAKDKSAKDKSTKETSMKKAKAAGKTGKKAAKKSAKKAEKSAEKKSAEKMPAPLAVKAEPMKVVAKEPVTTSPPVAPARVANG